MAMNPIQRKAQNSFLLGILVTLLITGIIIGILVVQLAKITKQQQEAEDNKKDIYVLTTDVASGESITVEKLTKKSMDSSVIPSNALSASKLAEMSNVMDESGENLIKQVNIVSKINLKKGTIITTDMIKEEGTLSNDVRKVEYNTITLGSQLETGAYIDIRLRLPSGGDYIVISHKQIEIPEVDGLPSLSTIWLELSETEILSLNCALIEVYKIEGAMLYATEYIEPGLQEAATETYIPNAETVKLIQKDPNCVSTAAAEIINRYLSKEGTEYAGKSETVRNPINSALNQNADNANDNVASNIETEIKNMQEERQKYLESLGG